MEASVTLLEATTPVKLPAKQCPHYCALDHERIASLSRYVMVDALNPAITSATQWFERTLDDSANKRLSIPEGFLAIDGILDLCLNVVDGLVAVSYTHLQ